jgi:two-component system cell cycle response regulator
MLGAANHAAASLTMHATLDHQLLVLLLESMKDAVVVLDAAGRVVFFNAGAVAMFGHAAEAMLGQPLDLLLPEASRERHAQHYRDFLASDEPSRGMAQRNWVDAQRADGTLFPVAATIVRARAGQGVVGAAILRDMSEPQRIEAELRRLSGTDSLTGLCNRRHLLVGARSMVTDARATGDPLSLLLLDMDHFKAINDHHGHLAGDHVLMRLADDIRSSLRPGDIGGRLGGEEFAVLLPQTSLASAGEVAETIRQRLEAPADDVAISATVSIGIAELWPGEDVDDLLRRADRALYQAKAEGRNRSRIALD